ncbi:DNA damage-binding protein 1a [Apiospora phragmitis]|uniref:DNA damage-binding protein 1a n=1 Tax=Apiospora phragmitis TaxID=2905665 RepID=A0ABR1X5U2_9PEZI
MAYVVPIHRPHSVRHALRASLYPEDEDDCLVLAKRTDSSSGKSTAKQACWSRLTRKSSMAPSPCCSGCGRGTPTPTSSSLGRTASNISPSDGTKRPKDSIATHSATIKREAYEGFAEPGSVYSRSVRPIHDNIGLGRSLECGPHAPRQIQEAGARLARPDPYQELFIRSATFLHVETGQPKVAFLYQTRTDNPDAQLVTYRLYSDDRNNAVSNFETKDQIERFEIQDPGAAMLIPVGRGEEEHKRYIVRNAQQARAQLGGFIVVGETRLLYYDDAAKKTVETALVEPSISSPGLNTMCLITSSETTMAPFGCSRSN